ncbi:MAG TPA: ATP-binding protein, partial [Candidatus Dormibacteraeota bacterium]|nr:ATP-binding protein [Candidatus Dormibacteraeota bacterium]
AVVAVALIFGTWAAVACSVAAFLLYDFFFIQPLYTFTVSDPREWLNLVLFLLVAVSIGQLTALQARRAAEATRRAEESQALFRISRTLATVPQLGDAVGQVLANLQHDARLDRAWLIALQAGREHVLADSGEGPPPDPATVSTLSRTPGDLPANWVRTHLTAEPSRRLRLRATEERTYRVKVEADEDLLGYLLATRERARGDPNREETRLLALAADQLGLALRRDALAREATALEVARQSDALKSALLDSVSHDLRTPLASIRAAAGMLMDPAAEPPAEQRHAVARTIDLEAERLNRIVRNLLDMSRIEGGALKPELEVFELDEVVEPVIERMRSVFAPGRLTVELPADLPPVLVDAVYVDEALTNLLENAARHGGSDVPVRVRARAVGRMTLELTVEDGGKGVGEADLPRLFEKFYRARSTEASSRRGLGIGLSVVKGLVEAMGGSVIAERSELGGLAVRLRLPTAPPPPDGATGAEA